MSSTIRDEATPGHASSAAPGVWLTDAGLVVMAVVWGVNYSIVKYGTLVLHPLAFNSVRLAFAATALVVLVALARARWPTTRTAWRLLALGVLGNGVYQVLFVEGIARTRAGDAALVLAASPALIATVSRLRGLERVPLRGAAGIALNIGGIAFVIFGDTHGSDSGPARSSITGDVLILSGALCWAVYSVLLKPYADRVTGLPLSALTMIGGAVPVILFSAPELLRTSWSGVPALGWGALVYSGLGALVIAYLLYYRGVRVLGPTRAAMYGNLQPLVAVIVAWIMLAEAPTVWQGLGAACILSGLLLTRV